MGNIPVFTRTVLPQTAQYGLIDVARQKGASEAGQFRQNAQNISTTRQNMEDVSHIMNDIAYRNAVADNTTWVNDTSIQFKRDSSDLLDQMREQRKGNPLNFRKDFDKELEKRQGDVIKSAPSTAARLAIKDTLANVRNGIYEDNRSWEQQRRVSMFAESLDRSANNMSVLAYRAGKDGKPLEGTGLFSDVKSSVIAGSTFVAPEKLEASKATMSKSVVSHYMEGLFESNPAKAKELLNSKKYDEILGADELERFSSKIKAQEQIDLTDEVSDMETAAKMGIEIPKEKLTGLAGRLAAAGMNSQADNVRDFMEVQDTVVAFAKKPLLQQREDLNAMRASVQAGNLSDAKKYAAMADVLQTKQDAIQKDPWSFYATRNIVAQPGLLDFSSQQALGDELDRRRVAVQQVKDLDGISIPLLTEAELDGLKKSYTEADPAQVSTLLTSIGKVMKPDEQIALAQAMAAKDETLAVALATDDPQVGERILMGTKVDGFVKEADIRERLMGKLDGVVTDPVKFQKMSTAIFSYYKTLQYINRSKDENVQDSLLDQAVTDVLGPVVSIDTKFGGGGTSNVLSYRDSSGAYVDAGRLQDTLKALTDDRIKMLNKGVLPVGTAGAVFTAKDIYKTGRFVSNGDGLYAAIDEFGEPISNKDGSIFQVDARELEAMIKGGK